MRIRERILKSNISWKYFDPNRSIYRIDAVESWNNSFLIKGSYVRYDDNVRKDLINKHTISDWLSMMRIVSSESELKEFQLKNILFKFLKLDALDELNSMLVKLEI